MKLEEKIVRYRCDVCGREFTNKHELAYANQGTADVVDRIEIAQWYIYKRLIMKDICWECNNKLYDFLNKLTHGFRYACRDEPK